MNTLDNLFLQDETKPIYPEAEQDLRHFFADHPWTGYTRSQRTALAGNPAMPHYHYTAPEGYFNDGTGLCRWQGKWHLFYGARPHRTDAADTFVWGHAVSEDLIAWRDLPFAIVNGPEPETWTGAVYAENNRVIAAYRAYGGPGEIGIGIAVSSDPLLLNWEKLIGPDGSKIVIRANSADPAFNTGDPCIWKKGNDYYLISGKVSYHAGSGEMVRQGYLFRSSNLVNWAYIHPFLQNDCANPICDDLSCPTFWPLDSRYIFIYYSHTYSARYIIGDYDCAADHFYPCASGDFANKSLIAGGAGPTTSSPVENGVIMFYEITGNNLGGTWFPPVFSLPHLIGLTGKYRDELTISPAGDYSSLRCKHRQIRDLMLRAGIQTKLEGFTGQHYETILRFPPDLRALIEVRLLQSSANEEFTRVCFYRLRGSTYRQEEEHYNMLGEGRMSVLTLDTTDSSLDNGIMPRAPEETSWFLRPNESLELHIFADDNIIEVFANDRVCLCARPMPTRADSTGISVTVRGGDVSLICADFWEMRDIGVTDYFNK
jgi:Beta-fructosidases (levanase/invertase)